MICSFKYLVFPKNPDANANGYMVGIYSLHEKLLDALGNSISEVKVVGHYLPTVENIRFDITGHWTKNDKHGTQFEMESYIEVIEPTREGIVAYLSSGLIKGIGKKLAEKIYDRFGDKTLSILDNDPEQLTKVPGINRGRLRRVLDTYLSSRGARDVITMLAPHGITPKRAVKIHREFGADTVRILRENPYRLCDLAGIGFPTADKIAVEMGLDLRSGFRIDAGLLHTLIEAETKGHLCLEKTAFVRECVKMLDTDGVNFKTVGERAFIMLKNDQLVLYGDRVYRPWAAHAEAKVTENIVNLLSYGPVAYACNLDAEINLEERRLGLKLVNEQRQAIKSGLTSRICIISGGPGTGKTLIQRVLLDIFTKHNPDAKIVCCAPTGRAARRMEQCTGFPASTVHKALGLRAGDDGEYNEPEELEADLILVDEVSMLDILLAKHLLGSIPEGSQLVLVGDADQLPSVGPGAVLSELIACGQIPVVKLDRVFRQSEGSRIAVNAKLIRHNNLGLEYGDDFKFIASKSYEESASVIEGLFQSEVSRAGLDNVALLTPFRAKTETGVNALNGKLRDLINPPSPNKPEATYGSHMFRLGDKVMQIKNKDEVNNGDVGYITEISKQDDETCVTVDFGDDRTAVYTDAGLDLLELAYASTVHKSQGSEYTSVIINIQNGHYIMLKRPLIYTAITRAKQRVVIVGDRRALCMAIGTVDAEKRGTMLAARINSVFNSAEALGRNQNGQKDNTA